MALLDKMRQHYGADLSDEEIITRASKDLDVPVTDMAKEVGYKTGGKWGSAASGAVDTMQSQAWDAGEAAAQGLGWEGVAKYAKGKRKQNEASAEIAGAAAEAQGLTTDWRGIRGAGDVGEFVGSTAIGSAPQMGVGLAGAAAGAAIGSVVPVVGTAVGGAAGYALSQLPLYFGANRQAQREQTKDLLGGERVDDTSALLAAGGQTALDMFGGPVGSAVRRGGTAIGRKLGREVLKEEAEEVAETGAKKAGRSTFSPLAMAKDFAVGGIKEGAYSEIPQQVLEEYARGAVDSSHDLLGSEAQGRYIGAAAGALALGGPVNAVTGAMGRAKANSRSDYDPTASKTEAPATVAGSKNAPAAGLTPEMVGPPREMVGPTRAMPDDSIVAAQAAGTVKEVLGTPSEARIDANAPPAPPTPEQTAADKRAAGIASEKAALAARSEKAAADGVDPKYVLEHAALEGALSEGLISEAEEQRAVAALATGEPALVAETKKLVAEIEKEHATRQQAPVPKVAGLSPGRSALAAFTHKETGKPMSEQARDRAYLILGLDEEGHPVGDPLTLQDVAEIEHRVQGKTGPVPDNKKALKAISKQLNEFGLDAEARRALYKQIHGEDMPLEGNVTAEGDAALQEGEEVEVEPEHRDRVTDSDESELQGAIGTHDTRIGAEDVGDTGSMRLVGSANQNVAVEEITSEQRADVLSSLIAGPGYNDAQKEAFKQALGSGKTLGSEAGAKKLLADTANFNEDELKALGVLFEHGKTTKAAAGRRARVEAVVARLTGEMTEHERQVRERQQAANNARLAQEELKRAELKAQQEGGLEDLDARLDEDGRTLRMHLMLKTGEFETAEEREERRAAGRMSRQERLIGESLADAKATYARLFADHAKEKDPNDHLPPWDELTPREQAAFVRMVDYQNFESRDPEHVAQGKIAGKAYEAQEGHAQRTAAAKREAEKAVAKAMPEFQAEVKKTYEAETQAETQRIIEESKARSQQRKEKLTLKAKPKAEPPAAPAPAPQEKPSGQQASPESVSPPKPEPVEAKAAPRVHRRASKPAVQAVVGGGTATAGKEVSKGSARGAPDATARAPHGPGPVRGEDGQAAPAASTEGDRADVAADDGFWDRAGPTGPTEEEQARAVLGDVPMEREYDENTSWSAVIPLQKKEKQAEDDVMVGAGNNWIPFEKAKELAAKYLSARQLKMPFQYQHMLGIAARDWERMIQAMTGLTTREALEGKAAVAPAAKESEYAAAASSFMEDNSSVEPDDFADPVKLENGKYMNAPDLAQAVVLSLPAEEHTDPDAYAKLGILPEGRAEVLSAVNELLASPQFQNVERLNAARDESPAPLTVTASAGTQVEGGVPRAPSVTRVVRRARTGLDEGTLTPEQFAAQATAALDAADAARESKPRVGKLRGADRIMEMLLAARRRGELDAEGVEMAMWFIRQNPAAVDNLGISIRAAGENEAGTSGYYNPVARIVTLIKGSLNTETAVHEILHHLERMMPRNLQNAIRRTWAKSLAKAYKAAQKAGNENLTAYYKALMDYHFDNGRTALLDKALDMLHSGAVGYEHYQHFNPSEFWAINGSRIVAGRFGVSGSVVGRIRQYLGEFVQKVKSVLGLKSDASIIRALNSVARADGTFTSGLMLQDQPGVHFMYAGQKTADQEQLNQLNRYHWMRATGETTAAQARVATGWFRNPIDGEMRYEIADHDAEFTTARPPERMVLTQRGQKPVTYRLDEVLIHPALFEAYPEARQILVSRQDDPNPTVQGWFNPDQNMVVFTPRADNPLSTLVHELQHWVQTQEGFAVGGSPEEVTHAMSPEQRVRLYLRASAEMAKPGYQSHLEESDRQRLEILLAGNLEPDPDALALYAAGTAALQRAYLHIAGEIEARDTQARLQMTPTQRDETTPLTSEKIGLKDVVTIRGAAGTAKSVEGGVSRRNVLLGALASAAGVRANAATDTLVQGKAQPINPQSWGAKISPAAEKLLRAGDLRGAIAQIAEGARDPRIAQLATQIYLKMGEGNGKLKTRVDDKGGSANHAEVKITPQGPTATFYTAKGARGLSTDTVLHEALHVVSLSAYYDVTAAAKAGNAAATKAVSEMYGLWNEFETAAQKAGMGKGLDLETRSSIRESIESMDEFFVRALTDPALQKFMATVPYEGKTLWDHFKDWVRKTLTGKAGIQPSWLDAATLGSERFLEAQGPQMAAWHQQAMGGAKQLNSARAQNIEAVRRAAVERVPARARPAVDTMSRMIGNSTKSLIKGLTFTRDLLQMAERGLGQAAADYLRLEEGRNATKIAHLHAADVVVAAHKKLSVAERAGVNAYLKKSTMEAKWGYRPDHFSAEDKAKVKVDPALEAIWKNTLNDAQRAVVKEVFKHGHETLTTMKTLVNLNVAAEFQAAIAQARAANDDKGADKLQADMDDQLAHFKTLLAVGEYHPYAPLKRFGNHVVVGKSQRYMDAEAALEANADDKAARKALREMQSNADHYYVSMHETQHEAQQERDRIAGQYDQADTMEKDRGYLNEVGGNRGMMGMFHRLRGQAEREGGNLDKKAQQATDRLLTDLYLSLLSETSARQSERERKNVAGADEDMMRAFHSKGRADANFLASLATGGAMQDALNAMEKEAGRNGMVNGTTREERHAHYREILSRHVMGMDYKQSPAVDAALKASSVMQLLTNPAYHLTNLLQPYVMSVPTLAGRFGMVKSMGAMMAAHRELGGRLFKNGVDHSSIEDLPSDVRKGIQALMDKGLINMSLDSEHGGEWNEGKLGKPIGWLKRVSERIEAVNRVATGVAALRLADKAGLSEQAAVNYAAKIIYDTHGDYSGFNTPSLMRAPVARLITQYRKFQLIQLHNYTRMVRDGFLRADLSKEEKWVARKALAYNLSTMFALGGTLALPGAQAVGAILRAIFGDDDEPDDPELTMRKYLADAGLEGISDLLVKGVPAWLGVDVSGRLGAGNIASLFPYADISDKGKSSLVSRKAFEAYALAATGPFIGGLAPKLADGLHDWSNGDPYKGTEKLMPSGLGNMLKGARIATQGVTMKSGDTVMDADQVGFLAGLGQAVGLPTTTVTERGQRGQALRNMDLFYKDKVSQIKREYVQAYRDGDAEKLAEARADWAEVGQRMKAHDLQPPKVSDLVKAPHAQAKKDKSLIEGVQTSKRTAGAARQLAELY